MKITKKYLQRIINEEIESILNEAPRRVRRRAMTATELARSGAPLKRAPVRMPGQQRRRSQPQVEETSPAMEILTGLQNLLVDGVLKKLSTIEQLLKRL